MNNTKLATLFYAGLSILIVPGLLIWLWAKDHSANKPFYGNPGLVVFLFAGCCLIASFLFALGLKNDGKKPLFLLPLMVSLLAGLISLVLAYFLAAIGGLGG